MHDHQVLFTSWLMTVINIDAPVMAQILIPVNIASYQIENKTGQNSRTEEYRKMGEDCGYIR